MPRKSKNIYQQYSSESLERAVNAVRHNGMSFRRASQTYSMPKTTIMDRVNGNMKPGSKPGRKPVIPIEVENFLATKIMTAAEKGFGLSKKQVIIKISRLCNAKGIKTPFESSIPGNDWWRGFKSEVTLRKPEKLNTSRSRMMNRLVVSNSFVEIGQVITENNLQSDVIWNADETGKGFEHNPFNVVARKGAKNIPGRTGNSRENITILAYVNAQGEKLPPLCVVKGKTTKSLESEATVDGQDGTLWTYQEKAWRCDILGDIFIKNCGPKRTQLLIMDSHGSHETLGLLDEAKKENIIVMALPPYTSHHLQPLDKSVFLHGSLVKVIFL
ncbi:unnamed protein product [Mytilus edulis]|uniref:HTH psq-type domain-containing protein n=1 Tax=Mytilus edulis TaxID=6550 RepID=A0A8S3PWM6_MYTED|nr:unnamed protein product [Mytilus edulis]